MHENICDEANVTLFTAAAKVAQNVVSKWFIARVQQSSHLASYYLFLSNLVQPIQPDLHTRPALPIPPKTKQKLTQKGHRHQNRNHNGARSDFDPILAVRLKFLITPRAIMIKYRGELWPPTP